MRRVLARRDARLYIAGQALSLFGDTSMWLALGIWAKTLTGSSGAAGLVFFAVVAPQLGAPAAGLLVDRVRRRPLLIAANLATGVVVLALLAVHGRGQLWLIYAVAALYGASYTVLGAGRAHCWPRCCRRSCWPRPTGCSRRCARPSGCSRRWPAPPCSACSAAVPWRRSTRPRSRSPPRR